MKNFSLLERGMMLVIFLYPVPMLALKGSLGIFFFVAVLLSAIALYRNEPEHAIPDSRKTVLLFSVAMLSVLVATLVSQIYHARFSAAYLDSPARFALAIPVYMALRKMDGRVITPLQYGLPLGAIGAFLAALSTQLFHPESLWVIANRISNSFLNPIHFGDLALMLGLLSVITINWFGTDSKALIALKLAGLAAGLYASIVSGTRGGWLAIPFVLLLWAVAYRKSRPKFLVAGIVVAASILVLGYFAVSSIHVRVNDTLSEISATGKGNLDSSMGQRLQIWKAASLAFIDNPFTGIGPDNEAFVAALNSYQQAGYINSIAATQGVCEVHSQPFSSAARLGVFGIASYLMVHLVPLFLFMRALGSNVPTVRNSALLGACLVVSFLVFGLTVEMYNLKMVASFYSLTVAILLASCHHIHCSAGRSSSVSDQEARHV